MATKAAMSFTKVEAVFSGVFHVGQCIKVLVQASGMLDFFFFK